MKKEIIPKTNRGFLTLLVMIYFKDKSTEVMCILYLNKLQFSKVFPTLFRKKSLKTCAQLGQDLMMCVSDQFLWDIWKKGTLHDWFPQEFLSPFSHLTGVPISPRRRSHSPRRRATIIVFVQLCSRRDCKYRQAQYNMSTDHDVECTWKQCSQDFPSNSFQ